MPGARYSRFASLHDVELCSYAATGERRAFGELVRRHGSAVRGVLRRMGAQSAEADDVASYLQTKYPEELGGEQTLVIHTDNSGEVSKKDLDAARRLATDVDRASSPVNAIVSVLMLREGWDVQNVTVVVGLRPYSSKANILPEQTVGRG